MRFARLLVALAAIALVLGACTSPGASPAQKLTIAAVQGGESAGLKAVAPDYEAKSGVDLEIVELPYSDLYDKLVTTFEANEATYDLIMMDDPWMPKFGTEGPIPQRLGTATA